MVNRSKANDPRFWKKWQESGAVGNFRDAYIRQMYNELRKIDTIEGSNEPNEPYARIRQMYNELKKMDTIEDAREPELTSSELLALASRKFSFKF